MSSRGRAVAERVLPAPAKLNLFLHVTGRRADGYHELQTLFQLLDWGDEVRLQVTRAPTIVRGAPVPGVSEAEDLSLRAARELARDAAADERPFGGARITLRKRIPRGSGMGGASSDAATVLHGLNRLWGCGYETAELADIGLRLGADVPVFVHGHSAWAEGVGERLTPVRLGERWYVLVFPGEGASTAELFADPALRRDAPRIDPAGVSDWCALGNDFLPVLQNRAPEVAAAALRLAEYGVPRLTGSGSTLFLEAVDESEAMRLTSVLKNHYNVRAVRGRDRSTLLDRIARKEHEHT